MRWLDRLRCLLRDLFGRDRFEREAREELESYLELSAEGRVRSGEREETARRSARLELGGVEQALEELRGGRAGAGLDALAQDVRYALRRLRRQPGFAAVAIATLALGIGASTAVVSLVRSVLLAPLPFHDSERLVRLFTVNQRAGSSAGQSAVPSGFFFGLRERSRLVERSTAQRYRNLTLSGDGEPERVVGIGVSDQWRATLGVEPLLGRPFSAEEERAGSDARVVLVSHGFWKRRFAGAPEVLGRQLVLDGQSYSVIGVMPPQFRYPYNADLWRPLTLDPAALTPGDLNVAARLRPGVTASALQQDLDAVAAALRVAGAPADVGLGARPMREEFQRDPSRSIEALAAAVGFVLLLACANLAALLLARAEARTREMAVRGALGAGRGRQLRQLLTESLVLAAIGGAAGVALALGMTQALTVLIPSRLAEVIQRVEVDGTALAVSALVCLGTGLLFGLAPALRLTRAGPTTALRDGGRPGSARGGRPLGLLVAGEVALATVLLVGAGLTTRNFARLLGADVGYETQGLLRIAVGLGDAGEAARRSELVRRIVDSVSRAPGVAAAGATSLQPIPHTRANVGAVLATDALADAAAQPPIVNERLVTPGYLEAMGLRRLAGRFIEEHDAAGTQPVAVVNEAAARRFWPGRDPLGQRLRLGRSATAPWHTVVGVSSDMAEPDAALKETVYVAYAQGAGALPPDAWWSRSVTLMVRAADGATDLLPQARRAVWDVEPTLPLFDAGAMAEAVEEPLSGQRLGAIVFAGFGGFGLLLAAIGTYGVLAFTVGRRIPEFGVRLALGAQPAQLLRGVLFEGLRLVAAGLTLGAPAALLLAPKLEASLSEVSAHDPLALAAAAAALLLVGGLASLLPALRATRVDPARALRSE